MNLVTTITVVVALLGSALIGGIFFARYINRSDNAFSDFSISSTVFWADTSTRLYSSNALNR